MIEGYGLDVATLIHEINHFVSKEKIIVEEESNTLITHYGIKKTSSREDLLYEIINEYMTQDITEILKQKLSVKHHFILNTEVNSAYLEIDNICNNPVKIIYEQAKPLIKDAIINGEGQKIMKILGTENYEGLNRGLKSVLATIIQEKRENPKIKEEEITFSERILSMIDRYVKEIPNKLLEYETYHKQLEEEINMLEEEGIIRRI